MSELDILRQYSSCEIADGLQKIGMFGYLPDIVMYSPEYCAGDTKVVGYAHTVKMTPVDPSVPVLPQHHVDCAQKDDVIIISTPQSTQPIYAVWGGLMAARAQFIEAAGVVIDGRCRDLEELRKFNFPVFARGVSVLGAGKYVQVASIGEPISVQIHPNMPEVLISKGDIIVGDLNGVVTFPKAKLEELINAIKEGVEADGKCMADIKKGVTIKKAFADHRGKKK